MKIEERPWVKVFLVKSIRFLPDLLQLLLSTLHTHTHTHTCSYRFLSGFKEVEHRTSQLVEPCKFPQPRNTTLLHKFYLAITLILEYTPTQCLSTRLPHRIVK